MAKEKKLFLHQTTTFLLCLFSVSVVGADYTCFSEDFRRGSLNIFDRWCTDSNDKLPFNVETYEKFQDIFEKPLDSNSFFITPNPYSENGSCIETVPSIFVSNNSRLLIDYYTSSPNLLQTVNWIVMDADTGRTILNVTSPIGNRRWVFGHFLRMPQDANIRVNKCFSILCRYIHSTKLPRPRIEPR